MPTMSEPETTTATAAEIAGEWMRADSILVLTHERPDGDAVGSALGTAEFLRSCGKRAEALFPEMLPKRYERFARAGRFEPLSPQMCAAYDLILVLDCANPARIATGGMTIADLASHRVLNIDHHRGNTVPGAVNFVDSTAAAASLLTFEIARLTGKKIPPEAATLWYLGITTDTGSFRFANTTPRVLLAAAELMELGAKQEAVVNAVYFSKPRNQQLFEAELMEKFLKVAADGKISYAVLPEEFPARHGFDMRDSEGVIDLLREIDGTVIAVLAYQREGVFKFSFRSKESAFPVGPFARSLGGGGHEMAAGATVPLPDAAAAEKFILENIPALLNASSSKTKEPDKNNL